VAKPDKPGSRVIRERGWLRAHRFLLLRRLSQLGILGLFLLGPMAGIWLVKGNLGSSLTLDVLPLTDPFLLIQSLFAGHSLALTAIVGALIVLGFYLLVGGRVYCSWVCPVNIVTDTAAWARRRLALGPGVAPTRSARDWLLGVTLLLAAATGGLAWELVNPVSALYRALVFGMGLAWALVASVFLFDLLIARRGWCGHLCPMGAFYSLPGRVSILRVNAGRRERCDDCMDCYAVCPEPQVIAPALKPRDPRASAVIQSGQCTNCARCIDVCSQEVFAFGTRFHPTTPPAIAKREEVP
jgi:ferredoxin-type protein NapH